MEAVLVTIGDPPGTDAAGNLRSAGAKMSMLTLPTGPSRVEMDAVLDALGGRRLVVDAARADLAAVLRRMMRRGELSTTETAVLRADGPFLQGIGIPVDSAVAAAIAVSAPCRIVGVLKDDSGNLVLDSAELRPWSGRRVWARAYVDDERLCDGEIEWLRVEHRVGGGVRASVPGRFARVRSLQGRALQLACDDAAITSDGSARDQPRRKRIWWDEPEQWLLACPGR